MTQQPHKKSRANKSQSKASRRDHRIVGTVIAGLCTALSLGFWGSSVYAEAADPASINLENEAGQSVNDAPLLVEDLFTLGADMSAAEVRSQVGSTRTTGQAGGKIVHVSAESAAALRQVNARVEVRDIPIGNEDRADFELTPMEIFTSEARVVRMQANGEQEETLPDIRVFKGAEIGGGDARLLLTVNAENEVFMKVQTAEQTHLLTALQTPAREALHLLVNGADLDDAPLGTFCSADVLQQHADALAARDEREAMSSPRSGQLLEAEIMVDVNFGLIANDFGGNVDAALSYAANLIAASSALYERDLNMRLKINSIFYWSSPDPFRNATTSDQQLVGYQQYCRAERTGEARDTAVLLADLDGAGGIAFLDAICNEQIGYAVANLNIDTTFPAQGYTWDLEVLTHELGHNFGSEHTHCYSPPIDCCYNECGCAVVPQRGTILSYCHLGGTGIDLYFHPRVIQRIQANVASKPCLSLVDAGDNGGGGQEPIGGCDGQSDDAMEPNNTLAQPTTIQPGQHQLMGCDTDVFALNVPNPGRVMVSINGPEGDLDLVVFDGNQQELARSATYTSIESVELDAAAGTLLIGVEPFNGQGSGYVLNIEMDGANANDGAGNGCDPQQDDSFEPNNSLQTAATIMLGQHQLQGCDVDVFRIDIRAPGRLTASINGAGGDLDMAILSIDEQALAVSGSNGSVESAQADVSIEPVLIVVEPYQGMGAAYTLNLEFELANGVGGDEVGCNGQPDDAFEPNNSTDAARPIQPGSHQLQGCDSDVFELNLAEASRVAVTIRGNEGDLDLFLLDAANETVADSTSDTSNESASAEYEAGVMMIAVQPYQGMGSAYTLDIDVTPTDTGSDTGSSDDEGTTITITTDACGSAVPLPAAGIAAGLFLVGGARRRRCRNRTARQS